MQIEDVIRLINMGLIVVCFYYMWHLNRWWASRPKEERLILTTVPLLLVIILFSSGESLVQNVGFGARLLLFTPVLILCIVGSGLLAKKIREVDKDRKEE